MPFKNNRTNMPVNRMVGSLIQMCNKIHSTVNASRFPLNHVISSSRLKIVDKCAVYLKFSHFASNFSKLSMKLFAL